MKVLNDESLYVNLSASEVEQILRDHVEARLTAGHVELGSYKLDDMGFNIRRDSDGMSTVESWSIAWGAELSNYQEPEE